MSQEVTVTPIQQVTREPTWVRWLLIAIGVGWFLALLLLPLATIFVQAFKQGVSVFFAAISEPDALKALGLTALVTLLSVPLNLVFGVSAAWAIARQDEQGELDARRAGIEADDGAAHVRRPPSGPDTWRRPPRPPP